MEIWESIKNHWAYINKQMEVTKMAAIKWLDENFEEFILMVLLVLMACTMGIQVIMRYVFNASLSWSEEITRYFFIWSSFISIGYCIKRGTSIKIDQFTGLTPKSVQKAIRLTVKVLLLAFFIYLFRYSIDVVRATIISGQKSPALGIPMYYIQMSTVVGFFMAVLRLLQSLIETIRPPRSSKPLLKDGIEQL